jgi:putative ABC transport system permease protein
MWRVSIGTLRNRLASFIGSFVAVVLAVTLGVLCGVLIDSSERAVSGVNRFSATSTVVQVDPSFTVEPGLPDGESEQLDLSLSPRLPAELVEHIAAVPGVADAVGDLSFYAQAVDAQGRAISGQEGGPALGHAWSSAVLTPFTLRTGAPPAAPDEVVIDAGIAGRGNVAVGDRISILSGEDAPALYTVSGIAAPPNGDAVGKQATLFFAPETAARLAGAMTAYDVIGVFGDGSVPEAELVRRLRAELDDPNLRVLPRSLASKAEAGDAVISFTDVSAFLGTMAGFSGFIAIFILANTFGISILQRTREIGLLRAVGATPRQVRRAVFSEALIVALAAAALGCLLGAALVEPFAWLLRRYGVAPQEFTPVIHLLPLLVAACAGILVTALAVLAAMRRAARIHPLQALREASVEPRRVGWWRAGFGLLSAGGAAVLLVVSADASVEDAVGLSVLFGFAALIAVAFLGPLLARPLVLVGGLLAVLLGGGEGLLARANARANLRRVSASTVPIILIVAFTGLVLFTTHIIQVATAEQSEERVTADLIIVPSSASGLPQPLVDELRELPGVAVAAGLLPTEIMIRQRDLGETMWDVGLTQGIDPIATRDTLDLGVVDGSLDDLHGATLAISAMRAEPDGRSIGDEVEVRLADGTPMVLTVVAVFNRPLGFADYALPLDLARAHTPRQLYEAIYVTTQPSTDMAATQAAVQALSERYPTLQAITRAQLVEQLRDAEDSEQWPVYLLIGLAAIYAALSIVNTLIMATAERRRELALLRLIGHTPRQMMRMIAWEAAIVLLSGVSIAAVIVGVAMAGISDALLGTPVFPVPWPALIVILTTAAALTFAASLLPAWLALRSDPISVAGLGE